MSHLVKWDPLSELTALQKQFFGDDWMSPIKGVNIPTTDVYTKDNALVVEAHLPNFGAKRHQHSGRRQRPDCECRAPRKTGGQKQEVRRARKFEQLLSAYCPAKGQMPTRSRRTWTRAY